MEHKHSFSELVGIIARLRGENGCPWDKVQTHESLKEGMIEEAYEVIEAIDKKDNINLCEELGDVLLQVIFHAQIESDNNTFDITDVIDGISNKMINRHPHIFGESELKTKEEVFINWEKIKKKEKKYETQAQVLKNIPDALPALIRAKKVQKNASDVGFDFSNIEEVIKKVYEECDELKEALGGEKGHIEEELGDILFSVVNIARFLQINPEFALTKATKKFINRFEYVEEVALLEGKALLKMSSEELDCLWNRAKTSNGLMEKENLI